MDSFAFWAINSKCWRILAPGLSLPHVSLAGLHLGFQWSTGRCRNSHRHPPLTCFCVSFGLDLLTDGQVLDLIYLSMLCLAWNSRSLQSFVDKNICPTVLQNLQLKTSISNNNHNHKNVPLSIEGRSPVKRHIVPGSLLTLCTGGDPLKSKKLGGNPNGQ